MLGFYSIGEAAIGEVLMNAAAPPTEQPTPGAVDATKVPAARVVIFAGGIRTVVFTGGIRTVRF